jgi:tetratricopeptide (TPR) repeat protein
MSKKSPPRQFLTDKTLGILLIGTVVLVIGAIVFLSAVKKSPDKETAKTLSDIAVRHMTQSEKTMREAQDLAAKGASDSASQTRIRQLLDQSITDAKKATDEDPNNAATWFLLSKQYEVIHTVSSEALPLAEQAITKAVSLLESPEILRQQAQIAIYQKKYLLAKESLEKAIKLKETDANLHFKLGNVLKELSDKNGARKAYQKALELTPKDHTNMHVIQYHMALLDATPTPSVKVSPRVTQRPTSAVKSSK